MDKTTKLQYQQQIEKYLIDKNVYNLFQELLQSLVIAKPEKPFDFLIQKLSKPESKKIVLIGPTGSNSHQISLTLANNLHYTCINTSDILIKEIKKKTPLGQQIEKNFRNFEYVKDDIVIELILKEIRQLQNENKNFILEGFPKTRPQGLAMQRAGIIPNTFVILNMKDKNIYDACLEKVSKNSLYSHIMNHDEQAKNHQTEYNLNLKELKEIYQNFFFEIDLNSKESKDPIDEIGKLIKYRIKTSSPKTVTKIVVTGPPGSGRTTLAQGLAKKYGLVYISTSELIKDMIKSKWKLSASILELYSHGDLISDEIMIPILNSRIIKTDCLMHGFVLDGFPKSLKQFQSLENLKISPTVIIALLGSQEMTLERLSYRKIDPITGVHYDRNANINQDLKERLIQNKHETIGVLQKRFERWNEILKYLEKNYGKVLFKTNSALDPNNILEKVSVLLENS